MLQGPPPQLEAECGGRHFSRGMREVVASCLNKDPNKRPTAKQLLTKGCVGVHQAVWHDACSNSDPQQHVQSSLMGDVRAVPASTRGARAVTCFPGLEGTGRATRQVFGMCASMELTSLLQWLAAPYSVPCIAVLSRRFFRQAKDADYLKRTLLAGLPPLPQRCMEIRMVSTFLCCCCDAPQALGPSASAAPGAYKLMCLVHWRQV